MEHPDDRKYTQDHEWVTVHEGRARVGITQFAVSELGEIVFVELPALNKAFTKGESFAVVESTKAASDVYAPISGKVIAVNEKLIDAPENLNNDPHGEGWLMEVVDFQQSEIDLLMDGKAYSSFLANN